MLELGAGTGVVGLGLALHGACCVLTDVAHILPLLRENVGLNHCEASTTVAEHAWGEPPEPGCAALHDKTFGLIVGGDLLYPGTIAAGLTG